MDGEGVRGRDKSICSFAEHFHITGTDVSPA